MYPFIMSYIFFKISISFYHNKFKQIINLLFLNIPIFSEFSINGKGNQIICDFNIL